MSNKFDQMDAKLDRLEGEMKVRFDGLHTDMNQGFEDCLAISKDIYEDLQSVKKRLDISEKIAKDNCYDIAVLKKSVM